MRLDELRATLESVARAHGLPGMVLAVARGDEHGESIAVGVDGRGAPLAPDSLLPVASITKLATALAVLRLADQGSLSVDDELARHLPDAVASRPGVTLRRLLCHTAGLPGDFGPGEVPYDLSLSWRVLAEATLRVAPTHPPGTRVTYSNIGVGLLAIVVERLSDQPITSAVPRLVLDPLGIEGYLGVEPARPVAWIAGGESEHLGTELEPLNSSFWRRLAFPYGGLVTTMAGALALARAFADGSSFLREPTRVEAVRNQTDRLGGGFWEPLLWSDCPWGLGPELRGRKQPHWAPPAASDRSFGHAGYSGCLAWCDPAAGVAWAVHGVRSMESGWAIEGLPRVGAAVLDWHRR